MTTNVLRLPGNYTIYALNGKIYATAGNDIQLDAASNIIGNAASNILLDAGSDINSTAGGNITEEAGLNIEETAGQDIIQDAIRNIEVTAGQDIITEAGNDYTLTALRNITQTSEGNSIYEAGGTFEITANSDITVTSPTLLEVQVPQSIFVGNVEIKENTIIGDTTNDTINVKARFISDLLPRTSEEEYNIGSNENLWKKLNVDTAEFYSGDNVGNPYGRLYDPLDVYDTESNRRLGSVYVTGGMGIEKDLNVGGFIYGRIETAVTTTFVTVTATNVDQNFYISFVSTASNQSEESIIFADILGGSSTIPGLRYNPFTGKITTERVDVISTDQSTNIDTGAVVIEGGLGVGRNINAGENISAIGDLKGSNLYPNYDNSGTIGTESLQWAQGYVENLYTNFIRTTSGPLEIAPKDPLTEIYGDIRVRGQNPIGTAPVVTNTLYVTVDGNDTNDGRAMDPSRACRTISGAVNSPYYQPGTQILVSAGHYLEDNPIKMKPYTSIRGSDIRTTFVEPINKTQDLFHVNSGCYLNYMTFLNGRSGLLEGPYLSEYNRGAYATAFPPLEGDERIDLFQSPYIQNCTNQSGPWLKDGTMFVPNQTVQVPRAVGIGSWAANTSTIIVDVSNGTLEQGMHINPGQQNEGFFNARTLLLANKEFIQEQVVRFVDVTFNSGTFVYDSVKCERDTGLIVDSISLDLLQESNSESIFAGLQYWRQNGYVDAIGNQLTTTTSAIQYLKTQVFNLATANGGVDAPAISNIVSDRFDDILNILNTSTSTLATGEFSEWVTNSIVPNSTATNATNYLNVYNIIQANKATLQNNVISYINGGLTDFTYNTTSCYRDTGFIVDAVVLDMLFKDSSQSNFAGVQYWSQGTDYVGGIDNEITTTTAAITYAKDLAIKIVQNINPTIQYQTSVLQNTVLPAATAAEGSTVGARFDNILNILSSGISGVSDIIVPNGISESTSTNVKRAYSLLQLNKSYIQSEVIAYIEDQHPNFSYDQTKCRRDVGYMIDSVSFDLLYGGNKQSVQSGVYYYEYNPSQSAVEGEIQHVVSAFNYLKQLMSKVILDEPITNTYQTSVQQQRGTPGSYLEVVKAEKSIEIVTNIVKNGPAVADDPAPIKLTRATEPDLIAGATLLNANRAFLQAEVIAYVNTLYTFIYDQNKCKRDVGHIIDSISFDLLHGGNKQSIKSGVYYFGYTGNTSEIPNEVPQTTQAYDFIKALIPNVVTGVKVINTYSNVSQVIPGVAPFGTNLTTATINEATIVQSKIDIITDIIRNGPSVAGERTPINLEKSGSSNVQNAYKLLVANKNFIKAETIAYINATFGTFEYSREKCFRDVGILVENLSYDTAFGGNEKSVQSGLAYYDGVISRIAGQESQTIAAIDYLNALAQKVVTNTTCTDLYFNGFVSTATYSQVRNLVLTGGSIASNSIKNLTNIVTGIIARGPDFAPTIYRTSNVDAAFVAAETLMQANKKFIQEDTINFINSVIYQGALPYSEIKCRRDTGLIIDSISMDLLHYTPEFTQSTFAGLQYWIQDNYVGDIQAQLVPTVKAIEYLKETTAKIIKNITPADDLIDRYQTTVPQNTSLEAATDTEVSIVNTLFDVILEIINGNRTGWTDRIISNGKEINLPSIKNAVAILQANKNYLSFETTAYVDATNFGFSYDRARCRRDVGYMIDAISFDLKHGGNRQSVQTGLYYYGFDDSNTSIHNQTTATVAAFNYLSSLTNSIVRNIPVTPLQEKITQVFLENTGTLNEVLILTSAISTITNIINNGTGSLEPPYGSIALNASIVPSVIDSYDLLVANKQFLVEEVITYIDQTFNPGKFNYNEAKCYRDIGLIIDAVSQDILLGGNKKSIEAGVSYWSAGYNYVAGQESTTTFAINYAKNLALKVIANKPVEPQTGTVTKQVINPFFQYGGDFMPQEAVRRNFFIITTIIEKGPIYAPPVYAGGGLFALTGLSIDQPQQSTIVTSVIKLDATRYLVGLNKPTIGFANNATLYFGDVLVFPLRDNQVEAQSLEYTGSTSTWIQRKVDQIGSMGGALIDGGVISDRSPIQSFVFDAYTQLTQGGRGVRITNDGYAQLVSVFTIFSSVGVQTDNGGIASIVNSNANFGTICLLSKGYGKRKFSGTIYNPPFVAFEPNSGALNPDFDQYYPFGFWPNGARVLVYCPDLDDRPHISLVMEIVPPDGHVNEQQLPGFLTATPSLATLDTGTITITGIDTEGITIGNNVYIRDQFGFFGTGTNFKLYADTGTVVADVGYQSVTLNKALTNGGGEPGNDNFFTLYFCGNAYYTVLSSEKAQNPKPSGVNILSTASTGGEISQIQIHIDSLQYLNSLTNAVINNVDAPVYPGSTVTQVKNALVLGGGQASTFIDLRFSEMVSIIGAPNLQAAESVIPPRLRTTSGPEVQGAGAAVSLINANVEFLAEQVVKFVQNNQPGPTFTFDETLCRRDSRYIITGTIYDVALGTNFNSITSGIAYRRSVSSEVIENELTQTLAAINYIKDRSAIAVNTSSVAVSRSNDAYQEVLEILARGESFADELYFTEPTGVNQNRVNAKNILIANKEFIKTEIVAWIQDQIAAQNPPFNVFYYDAAKCARDVGYIIDAVSWDYLLGSNFRSITAGLAYYRGNSADVIGYQKTQTLAALNQLKTLMSTASGLSGANLSNLQALIQIVINIFDGGTSVVPSITYTNPTNAASGFLNAKSLLSNNKDFIKAEIVAWIQSQVTAGIFPFSTNFTYDSAACARDVGFIVDALLYDVTYGGNLETVVASRAYFEGTQLLLGEGEKLPTLATYNYLKNIVDNIVLGQLITKSPTNALNQSTVGTAGSTAAATFLQARVQEIYDTISSDGTIPIEIIPDISWVTNSAQISAYNNLQSNRSTLQADIISWINSTYTVFTYSQEKCARDVGYIIDGLCYDILYGGNSASVISARAYYEGVTPVLPTEEQNKTVAAFSRLSTIIGNIVQNIEITPSSDNFLIQNTLLDPVASGSPILTELSNNVTLISTAVDTGSIPNPTYPSLSWVDSSIQTAVENLRTQQETIIDDMIAFVNDEFSGPFTFNVTKCKRDVKIILQRLIYDIETGGRYNSVLVGLSYWSRNGAHHIVQLGENVRRTDLFPDGATVNFYQRSYMSASGYVFEYVGAGIDYGALPQRGVADPVQGREVVMLNGGKVFFTSTDQNGDFRIGPGLVISQATGVLSGRTFTKSLFANMTPFILAIESGS